MQNNPAEAVVFLERAVQDEPANVKAWLYLGIVFEQLNRPDEAISVYRRVLPMAGSLSANVANNLGNVYFHSGNNEMAEQYYTQAIGFDSVYSRAFLGRANTRIRAGNFQNAIMDYEQYLMLEPRSSQRPGIEQLISLVRAEAAAEERRRQAAEEEARRIGRYILENKVIKDLNAPGLNFISTDFSSRSFYGCNFMDSTFSMCLFTNAEIQLCFFDYANFIDCDFSGGNLQFLSFAGASIQNCTFENSELVHLNYCGTAINDTTFNNSNLYNSRFINAGIENTDFIDCNVKKVFFLQTKKENVSLKSSNTAEAVFEQEEL